MIKVLIVDDDRLITVALQTILEADPEVQAVGTGVDGRQAVEMYRRLHPDVLLMDIRMEGMNGLEAAEEILAEDPDARILLLTTFLDDEYIVRAIRAGCAGYLLKQDYASLLPAVRAVASGQTVFGSAITAKIPGLLQQAVKDAGAAKGTAGMMNGEDSIGAASGSNYSEGAGPVSGLNREGMAGAASGPKVDAEAGPAGRADGDAGAVAFAALTDREMELAALVAEGLSNKEIAGRMYLSEGTVRNYLSVILEKLELRDRTQLAIFYLTGKDIPQ